jgi:hypothetical protein
MASDPRRMRPRKREPRHSRFTVPGRPDLATPQPQHQRRLARTELEYTGSRGWRSPRGTGRVHSRSSAPYAARAYSISPGSCVSYSAEHRLGLSTVRRARLRGTARSYSSARIDRRPIRIPSAEGRHQPARRMARCSQRTDGSCERLCVWASQRNTNLSVWECGSVISAVGTDRPSA